MKHLVLGFLVLSISSVVFAANRPNFLLVMVDDMGFSDLGCFGSEIETPNMDRLASNGVRFTQFYNTAKCHSSRVSLLSGRWCRQAGDETLRRAVIIPEVLAPAGYFTAMSGKWHLSKEPTDFGFQRYFGHLSGATNYYLGDKTFRLNGEKWEVPIKGFYTTIANVDRAIEFIGQARSAKRPWFQYIAFNAPHAPLQPLEQDYAKYLGHYDAGWDVMRAARVAKQKQIGLLSSSLEASPRPEHVRAWEDMSADRRAWEAKRMAAYAGLIDRVDQEMGRLIADLEKHGDLDNTVILFVSDNGACPYDRGRPEPDAEPFDPNTTWSDSTGWAWARNSPFRYYKQNQFEGGISTPAILHWPAGVKQNPGSVIDTPAHLVDVLPTFAELADAKLSETFPDRELTPIAGTSLVPIISGGESKARPPIHLLFSADRGLRDGDWKLVSFQSAPWELHDMRSDRTELHNVAAEHPEIVERMVKQWHEMTEKVLMAPAKERAPVSGNAEQHVHREWTDFDQTLTNGAARKGNKKSGSLPRARKGTTLSVENNQLILQCNGDDPGLAFGELKLSVPGPYVLEFRMQSHAGGSAEIYWTTDAQTILPKGKHQDFEVNHDGNWHDLAIRIEENQTIHALRLDPYGGAGEVRLDGLVLKGADGEVLAQWP